MDKQNELVSMIGYLAANIETAINPNPEARDFAFVLIVTQFGVANPDADYVSNIENKDIAQLLSGVLTSLQEGDSIPLDIGTGRVN